MPASAPKEVSATVSTKGQLVIPGDVRKRLGLVKGSVVRFVFDEDAGVRLLSAAGDVRRLKGRLTAPTAPVSVDEMGRAVAERRRRIAAA